MNVGLNNPGAKLTCFNVFILAYLTIIMDLLLSKLTLLVLSKNHPLILKFIESFLISIINPYSSILHPNISFSNGHYLIDLYWVFNSQSFFMKHLFS